MRSQAFSRLSLGTLAPLVLGLALVLDAASRFVSYDHVTFRAWEALGRYRIAWQGAFEPSRAYVNEASYGDLAARGNYPDIRQYRTEMFTTDKYGFRNRDVPSDQSVELMLVGTSFAGGCSLSDDQTLNARISELMHKPVYNATSAELGDPRQLTELLGRLQMTRGVVIHEFVEHSTPPSPVRLAPSRLGRIRAHLEPVFGPNAALAPSLVRGWLSESPLKLALYREYKRLNDDRVLPNSFASAVVRGELLNGDPILFHPGELTPPEPEAAPQASAYWITLSQRLQAHGLLQVVVLVPSTHTVYGPLLKEPHPSGASAGRFLEQIEHRLREGGVPVINLTRVFQEAARRGLAERRYIYWRDDTHWNAAGVELAAQQIVKELQAVESLKSSL